MEEKQKQEIISNSSESGQLGKVKESSIGQPPSQTPGILQPDKKPRNKVILIILSLSLIIVAIAGVASAYFYYFRSPDKIFHQAIGNLFSVESMEFAAFIKSAETDSGDINMSFIGTVDRKNLSDIKADLTVKTETKYKEDTSGNISSEINIRKINNTGYMKLVSLEPSYILMPILDEFKDQWIKLDEDQSYADLIFRGFGSIGTKSKESKGSLALRDISDEQKSEIKKLFLAADAFKVVKKLPDEILEGSNTYHFQFQIDKPKVEQLFLSVFKIIENRDLSNSEVGEVHTAVEGYLANNLDQSRGNEIWIGKKDNLPHKMILNSKIFINMFSRSKDLAKLASFRSSVISMNPAAMDCADQSILNSNEPKIGSAVCSNATIANDSWPNLTSNICDGDNYTISVSDSNAADGKYNFSVSCLISGTNVSVECNEIGCNSKPESLDDFQPANEYSILTVSFKNFNKPFQIETPEAKTIEDLSSEMIKNYDNNQDSPKAEAGKFKGFVVSADAAAVACAEESSILSGAGGQPICKNQSVENEKWPSTETGLCTNDPKFIAFDNIAADGKYSYAAVCHNVNDNSDIIETCSQNDCISTDEESTDADNDNFPDRLESIFGTNPASADSDGDGYKDGDELIKGYNPLIKGD